MSSRVFTGCVILVVLVLNAYPIYQMATTGGYLFYQNAFDEPGYLNYDMAREVTSLSRVTQVGEYLVLLGHEVGLSGGWINFVLDVVTLATFLVVVRLVFKQAGFEERRANLFSLLLTTVPMILLTPTLTGINLFNWYMSSPLLGWLAAPSETNFLPISRTPEPQVTLVILSMAVWLALRLKSFIPLYVCLPVLYPFVAIPTTFILIAMHLRQRFARMARYLILPPLFSFLFISILLTIYFGYFVNPSLREAMAELRTPLLSFMGSLALIVFLVSYYWIKPEHRYFVGLVALAPSVGVNQQVISGWIAQPYNFELYAGTLCLTIVVLFAVYQYRSATVVLVVAGIAAIAYAQINPLGAFEFHFNEETNRPLLLHGDLLDALRTDSEHVVISDLNLASAASLIFPRQPATALAFQRTIGTSFVNKNFASYLCTRQAILNSSQYTDKFRADFAVLDHAFKYQGLDYALLHLGQKKAFALKNDPTQMPTACPATRYWILSTGTFEQLETQEDLALEQNR